MFFRHGCLTDTVQVAGSILRILGYYLATSCESLPDSLTFPAPVSACDANEYHSSYVDSYVFFSCCVVLYSAYKTRSGFAMKIEE
jgi:hypothetical protein